MSIPKMKIGKNKKIFSFANNDHLKLIKPAIATNSTTPIKSGR